MRGVDDTGLGSRPRRLDLPLGVPYLDPPKGAISTSEPGLQALGSYRPLLQVVSRSVPRRHDQCSVLLHHLLLPPLVVILLLRAVTFGQVEGRSCLRPSV